MSSGSLYQCTPNRDKTKLTDDDELTMLTRVMMDLEMRVSARWTHMSWNTPKTCPGIVLDIFETVSNVAKVVHGTSQTIAVTGLIHGRLNYY